MVTINKLNNSNYMPTMEVLKREPSYNLFFIGDIEVYGCESDMVEVWNQVEEDEITGVLLRYNTSFIVYYIDDTRDKEPFAEIVRNINKPIEVMSGKPSNVLWFQKLFPKSILKDFFFCELTKDIDVNKCDTSAVKIAKPDDAPKLCALRNVIEEFSSKASVESVKDAIEKKMSRYYYIGDSKKVYSMAATTAENSMSAMIVAVCTDIEHRRKGYMTTVLTKMCYDLQQDNKHLCLFYDNIDAGRIYHSMGFETTGKYAMIQTNMNDK